MNLSIYAFDIIIYLLDVVEGPCIKSDLRDLV